MIDIKGIEKGVLLHQLWRFSQAQGISYLGLPIKPVNEDTFREIIKMYQDEGRDLYFDYLMGKVMKIDISADEMDPWLYDRDNGVGQAQLVVNYIRQENK